MSRPSSLPSRLESAFTAVLLALVLATALITLFISAKIRLLVHESGQHLSWAVRSVVSVGWWPAWLTVLLLATAATLAGPSPRFRRLALAAGLALGASALVGSWMILFSQPDLRALVSGGSNSQDAAAPAHVPRQLDPDR